MIRVKNSFKKSFFGKGLEQSSLFFLNLKKVIFDEFVW